MAKLSGRTIKTKYIELHGQFGEFNVPNKKIKVHYFSTFASGKNKLHDSFLLLRELKPMRERVKAKDISNLNSLLQRNLNDFRVSRELVPYLKNESSPIAFFPAILAALLPKGFISQNEETDYPNSERIEAINEQENTIINYGDNWNLEIFRIDGQETTLGLLSIDTDNVDVVVLDGQHRANAFRVVSGTFENEKNSIYSAFYKDVEPITDFNADLPVTIIWFDNDRPKFDPKIIARRLFVDVNNTAKKVSQSRTILLDEYEVPSLLTRFFYSMLADIRQFDTAKFSLFYSDFDLDSDINVSANNTFAITSPQIIYDIFSWFTLGRTDQYNAVNRYSVGRESFRNSLTKFGNIFTSSSFNERHIFSDDESPNRKRVIVKDIYNIEVFEEQYRNLLGLVMFDIFSKFNFFLKHFEASEIISHIAMDHTEMAVWEDVFLGGEGLYYTFKDKNLREQSNPILDKYVKAIDEIERKFKDERAKLFGDIDPRKVNSAFDSANSKAFQIGLFMALDVYREESPLIEVYDGFLAKLNSKSENDWIYILTDIKQKVIKGADPKKWPAYQNLILRAIQDESNIYYESSNFLDSPDGRVFGDMLDASFNLWLETNDEIEYEELSINTIGTGIVKKWTMSAKESTEALFHKAHIVPIFDIDYITFGRKITENLISKIR